MDKLKKLSKCSGRHTSLVTLAIAANSDLTRSSKLLNNELATATNNKDKNNLRNVMDALSRIRDIVRDSQNKKLSNGLVVCSGWCI